MDKFAAAGLGFLLAVLWFDLMFDTQTRAYAGDLPPEVLASISGYYRRVTTDAHPMNRLVASVMVLTLAAIGVQAAQGGKRWWVAWVSLAIVGLGVVLTLTRTVPNAVRLGSAVDTLAVQSSLARAIYHDHLFSFARTTLVLGLQLFAK
ncbi:MAG TPA: hypothetical protein VII72_15625 [Myxococcota bacterium]|jgi:hypothetical protein